MKSVIFIRGWASLEESFKGFRESCPKGYKVEIISAELLLKKFDLNEATTRLKEIIEKKEQRVILSGHSLGGALALYFTSKYPELVSRLILVNSTGTGSGILRYQSIESFMLEHLKRRQFRLKRKLREAVNVLKNPLFQAKLAYFAHILDLKEEAKAIKVPTTLIWGNYDLLVPVEQGMQLHQLIHGSKFIELEGMDHDWVMHSPELFWEKADF